MARFEYTTATEAPPDEGDEREPDIALSGIGQLTGEKWREEFHILQVPPAVVIDDLMASVRIDAQGNFSYVSGSILRFFQGVIVDAEQERWHDLMRDTDRAVDLTTLTDILQDLSQELLGLPPTKPSKSGRGQARTNGTSGAGSSGRVTAKGTQPAKPQAKRKTSTGR